MTREKGHSPAQSLYPGCRYARRWPTESGNVACLISHAEATPRLGSARGPLFLPKLHTPHLHSETAGRGARLIAPRTSTADTKPPHLLVSCTPRVSRQTAEGEKAGCT